MYSGKPKGSQKGMLMKNAAYLCPIPIDINIIYVG